MWGRSGLQGRKGKRPAAGNLLLSHPCAGCAPGETLLFDVKEAGILVNFIFQHSEGNTVPVFLFNAQTPPWNTPSSLLLFLGRKSPSSGYTTNKLERDAKYWTLLHCRETCQGSANCSLLWECTPAAPKQAQKAVVFKKDWAVSEWRGHIPASLHDCSTKWNCCKGRLKHKGKEAAAASRLWIPHLTFLSSSFLSWLHSWWNMGYQWSLWGILHAAHIFQLV